MSSDFGGRSMYRQDEGNKSPGSSNAMIFVNDQAEAEHWNNLKWGIFWTVNEFKGERKKENLVRINSWAFDFDTGSKQEQKQRIKKLGLEPSLVIESCRGFHVYYDAIDGTEENFSKIMEPLIVFLGADKNAKDTTRLFRPPYFFHWKDPSKPFLVKVEHQSTARYFEREMLSIAESFQPKKKEISKPMTHAKPKLDGFYDKVDSLNCVEALRILSGSSAVGGERYEFISQRNGKTSVIVNGKSANVWIDSRGRIGSGDKGGPTVYQWLKWFNHDHERIKQILQEYFPGVF